MKNGEENANNKHTNRIIHLVEASINITKSARNFALLYHKIKKNPYSRATYQSYLIAIPYTQDIRPQPSTTTDDSSISYKHHNRLPRVDTAISTHSRTAIVLSIGSWNNDSVTRSYTLRDAAYSTLWIVLGGKLPALTYLTYIRTLQVGEEDRTLQTGQKDKDQAIKTRRYYKTSFCIRGSHRQNNICEEEAYRPPLDILKGLMEAVHRSGEER